MAQRGGSIFISTNPQNNVPIGLPGQGVFIGCPGPTIYGRGPGAIDAGGLIMDMTGPTIIDMTTMQINLE